MLPERTKVKPRIISKKKLLQRDKWTTQEREQLTQQIKSLSLTHQLDEKTLHIPAGDEVKQIAVLKIELKDTGYSLPLIKKIIQQYKAKILVQLCDNNQNIIWILFHCHADIQQCYVSEKNVELDVRGNTMDEIYLQFINQIHPLIITPKNTMDEILKVNQQIEQLKKNLAIKEKQMYSEKNIKKQVELKKEICKLKKELEELGYGK